MQENVTPPFSTKGSLPDKAYKGDLEIIIHQQADPRIDPFTRLPYTLEPSMEMVKIFEHAVNAQMFNCSPAPPRWTEMLFKEAPADAASGARHYRYQANGLYPESFLYLMAMLSQTRYANDPIDCVEINPSDDAKHILPMNDLWAFSKEIPPLLPMAFDVNMDDGLFDKNEFEVTIQFQESLPRQQFERVKTGLEIWDEMRLVGGFLLDFSELDAPGNYGHVAHQSPKMVQLTVMDYFDGRPSAMNLLVNYAKNVHSQGLKLTALTIE